MRLISEELDRIKRIYAISESTEVSVLGKDTVFIYRFADIDKGGCVRRGGGARSGRITDPPADRSVNGPYRRILLIP